MHVSSTCRYRHPLPIVRLCICASPTSLPASILPTSATLSPTHVSPPGLSPPSPHPHPRARAPHPHPRHHQTHATRRAPAYPPTSLAQARSPYAPPAESPPVSILTRTRALDARRRCVFERSSPRTTAYIHIPTSPPAASQSASHTTPATCRRRFERTACDARVPRGTSPDDLDLAACTHSCCDTCIPILVPRCPTVPSVRPGASFVIS
ncbi:hypothetical protein C8J57DRAFT_219970 [Mycena rebaudengoi]|nr:hypothetical protein C8J57DRAFT_219970 [Mycena rebaudengoi]